MSGEPTFVDTNVLVYAYDLDAGAKHDAARARLQTLWEDEAGLMSTQVLQEFYVTVTRKLSRPLPRRTAGEVVGTYGAWPIHRPDVDDLIAASEARGTASPFLLGLAHRRLRPPLGGTSPTH